MALPIDNNSNENRIRPIAIIENWLFPDFVNEQAVGGRD
jgi:hypothetical protein